MTVNDLIKVLNKIENKETIVTISIEYGWGEEMKCVVDNFNILEKNEYGLENDEFCLMGEEEDSE